MSVSGVFGSGTFTLRGCTRRAKPWAGPHGGFLGGSRLPRAAGAALSAPRRSPLPGPPAAPPSRLPLPHAPGQDSPILAAGPQGALQHPSLRPCPAPSPLPSTPAFLTGCPGPIPGPSLQPPDSSARSEVTTRERAGPEERFVPKSPLRKDPQRCWFRCGRGARRGPGCSRPWPLAQDPERALAEAPPTAEAPPLPASPHPHLRPISADWLRADAAARLVRRQKSAQTPPPQAPWAGCQVCLPSCPGPSVSQCWAAFTPRAFYGSSKGLRPLVQGGPGWRLALDPWSGGTASTDPAGAGPGPTADRTGCSLGWRGPERSAQRGWAGPMEPLCPSQPRARRKERAVETVVSRGAAALVGGGDWAGLEEGDGARAAHAGVQGQETDGQIPDSSFHPASLGASEGPRDAAVLGGTGEGA